MRKISNNHYFYARKLTYFQIALHQTVRTLETLDAQIEITAQLRLEITKDSHAIYYCEARSVIGEARKSISVIVEEEPKIEMYTVTNSTSVSRGDIVEVFCSSSGLPEPDVVWFIKNQASGSEELPDPMIYSIQEKTKIDQNSIQFQATDSITIQCIAQNLIGQASEHLGIVVNFAPKFVVPFDFSSQIEIDFESLISWKLNVEVESAPKAEIVCKCDEFNDIIGRSSIILSVPDKTDSNILIFNCEASNEIGSDNLQVQIKILRIPEFKNSENQVLNQTIGKNLLLDCGLNKNDILPKPIFEWFKDGQKFDEVYQVMDNEYWIFKIENIQIRDSGKYTCIVKNGQGGGINKSFHVSTLLKPRILPVLKKTHKVIIGENVKLGCQAEAIPPARYEWFKDGSFLADQKGAIIALNSILPSAKGIYTCAAINSVGQAQINHNVDVLIPPKRKTDKLEITSKELLVGQSTSLFCNPDPNINPKPKVTWSKDKMPVINNARTQLSNGNEQLELKNLQSYDNGIYTCTIRNIVGESRRSFELKVHDHPAIKRTNPVVLSKTEGESVYLACDFSGIPLPTVTWHHVPWKSVDHPNELSQENTDSLFEIDPASTSYKILTSTDNSRLVIYKLASFMSGQYECRAENKVGSDSDFTTLNIYTKPVVKKLKPQKITETLENQGFELNCDIAEGNPSPKLSWTMTQSIGGTQQITPVDNSWLTDDLSRLFVEESHESVHNGIYTCTAHNIAGEASVDWNVKILKPPRKVDTQINEVYRVSEGQTVTVRCIINASPPYDISWFHNRNKISSTNPKYRIRQIESGETLTLFRVNSIDDGEVGCTVSNKVGKLEQKFPVTVLTRPRFEPMNLAKRVDITKIEGELVELRCPVVGNPTPKYSWSLDGVLLEPGPNTVSDINFPEAGILKIKSSNAYLHDGHYNCIASNEIGVVSRVFMVRILTPPKITTKMAKTERNLGSPFMLTCDVTGNPMPKIAWTKILDSEIDSENDSETDSGVTIKETPILSANRIFYEISAKAHHSGTYMCTATNKAGKDAMVYNVEIFSPPKITTKPSKRNFVVGENVILECEVSVSTNPKAVVSWKQNGKNIGTSVGKYSIHNNALHISNVSPEDRGHYTCSASNRAGSDQRSHDIGVFIVPYSSRDGDDSVWVKEITEGGALTLYCDAVSIPPPKIAWYYEDEKLPENAGFADRYPSSNSELSQNYPNYQNPQFYPFYKIGVGSRTLQLTKITNKNAGNYKCIATNVAGAVELEFNVVVNSYVQFENGQQNRIIKSSIGETVQLDCDAESQGRQLDFGLRNEFFFKRPFARRSRFALRRLTV